MSTALWEQACSRLDAAVRRRLASQAGLDITVAPLGGRDELVVSEVRLADGSADRSDRGPLVARDGLAGSDSRSAGQSGRPSPDGRDELVVLDGRLADEAAVQPDRRLTASRPIPIHLTGRYVIVGPLDHGTCARCLARRWQRSRDLVVREALELGTGSTPTGEPPQVTDFGAETVAAVIAQHLADRPQHTLGDPPRYPFVYQVDLETLAILRVRLVTDPACPDCGPATRTAAGPAPVLDLQPAPRSRPGSFRVGDLDDYDLPVDALVNTVCGTLGRGVVPELDLPTTASVFGTISERVQSNLYEVFWGGHADTYGHSFRIGILEGLERYAGLAPRGRPPALVAALDDLAEPALDPRLCGMYAPAHYALHPETEQFSSRRAIPWVQGYSLRDDRPILVPKVLTYYHSEPRVERFVQECSNGCASGGSLAEAVLYGLMEVVERDAFLLAWYSGAALPELDPHTSRRAETRQLVERLAMYGYQARFFDTRMAFPVPVITAVAVRTTPGLGALSFGAGASFDPEEALSAGLAEIATDALRSRRRTERGEAGLREMAADFDKVLALHDHSALYGLPEMAVHAAFLLDRPDRKLQPLAEAFPDDPATNKNPEGDPTGDIRDDLARCVGVLAAAGFDTIAVDQTTPEQRDLGLHTASVIVPGLVPIDFGWSRQRVLHLPRLAAVTGATTPHLAPHPFP